MAMNHDRAALRPGAPSTMPGETPVVGGTPAIFRSPTGSVVGSVSASLAAAGSDALDQLAQPVNNEQSNIKRSAQLVQSVYDMKRRNDELIVKIRGESVLATKRVLESLAKRTKELADMKKSFEAGVLDIEHARARAERALQVEVDRLDPGGFDTMQQERVAILRAALADLTASKASLQEDLRDKIVSLDIDNSCRRQTPQMACEPAKRLQPSQSSPQLNFRSSNGLAVTAGRSFYAPSVSSSPTEIGDSADSTASTAATGSHAGCGAHRP